MKLKLTVFFMVLGMVLPGLLPAAEILTEEDFVKKVVVEEDFIKTADNFIILFDGSSSMNVPYAKGAKETKAEVAKRILQERNKMLPYLGYKAGLYQFTPYKEVYPVGPYNRATYTQAINSLPDRGEGPTNLQEGLRKIEPVLKGLSGRTVMFLFSDGTYTQRAGKLPEDYTREFADKYNVCFYMIGDSRNARARKQLVDMAKANSCSRVLTFKQFTENPNFTTGALYVVKSTERVETITETRITGIKVGDLLFDFAKDDVQSQYGADLEALGNFLKKNPNAYALLVGYSDSIGSEEYNLYLSNRRAESVAAYLMNNFGVSQDQIVVNWYGKANPVASNDTDEGRALNRRVEIAVGGL